MNVLSTEVLRIERTKTGGYQSATSAIVLLFPWSCTQHGQDDKKHLFVIVSARNSKDRALDAGYGCGARKGETMARVVANNAELEYAVMLAVLDFQSEFMKSTHSNVQAHVLDELISVRLTPSAPIPAEKELARSPEGRELLRRFYRAMFDSCHTVLQERIERAIGVKIHSMVADLDPSTGKSTIVIRLPEPLFQ